MSTDGTQEKVVGSINIMPDPKAIRDRFAQEFIATVGGFKWRVKMLWTRGKKQAESDGYDPDSTDWEPGEAYESIRSQARLLREEVVRVHDLLQATTIMVTTLGLVRLDDSIPESAVFTYVPEGGGKLGMVSAHALRTVMAEHDEVLTVLQDKGSSVTCYLLGCLSDIEECIYDPDGKWAPPDEGDPVAD